MSVICRLTSFICGLKLYSGAAATALLLPRRA